MLDLHPRSEAADLHSLCQPKMQGSSGDLHRSSHCKTFSHLLLKQKGVAHILALTRAVEIYLAALGQLWLVTVPLTGFFE